MLRFFSNYQKSFLGIIIIAMICISMLFFGTSMGGGQRSYYAIKIDEQEIPYEVISQRRRQIQEQYRSMLKENYYKLAEQLMKNINEKIVDQLINETLIKNKSQELQLFVGKNEIKNTLFTKIFPNGFSREKYSALLGQLGQSATQFEQELEANALLEQFQNLLNDTSLASELEAKALLKENETLYEVDYVEIDPVALEKDVPDPKEELLNEFYENNATDFEAPPRVAYEYLSFAPKDHLDLVQIQPEDVELYYTDNQRRYRSPEQAKVRHIVLQFPEEEDPKKMVEVEEKAKEVHAKAQAGEDFTALALQYSDDLTTKTNGGDLGWIKRGEQEKALEAAAFKMTEGGLTELVSTDYGYEIIYVDEYKAAAVKPLEDVQAEIEEDLRKREAPAFTSAMAQDLYDNWLASEKSLVEFAKEEKLEAKSTAKLMLKREDPEALRGLTARILEAPELLKQLIELRSHTVLVGIADFKDTEVPPLAEIKDDVLKAYKKAEAKKNAIFQAQELVDEFDKYASLAELAKAKKLEIKKQKDFGKSKGAPGLFSDADVKAGIFASTKTMQKPSKYHTVADKHYVFQIANIAEPAEKDLEEKLKDFRKQASSTIARNLNESIINQLKASAEIDVSPGVVKQ